MKLVKQANKKPTIKMSKREWLDMGKKAGWLDNVDRTPVCEECGSLQDDVGKLNDDRKCWTCVQRDPEGPKERCFKCLGKIEKVGQLNEYNYCQRCEREDQVMNQGHMYS